MSLKPLPARLGVAAVMIVSLMSQATQAGSVTGSQHDAAGTRTRFDWPDSLYDRVSNGIDNPAFQPGTDASDVREGDRDDSHCAVPLPGAAWLMLGGVVGLGTLVRRRRPGLAYSTSR